MLQLKFVADVAWLQAVIPVVSDSHQNRAAHDGDALLRSLLPLFHISSDRSSDPHRTANGIGTLRACSRDCQAALKLHTGGLLKLSAAAEGLFSKK